MLGAFGPSLEKRSQLGKACVWCPLIRSAVVSALCSMLLQPSTHSLPWEKNLDSSLSCIKIFLHATIFSSLGHSHRKRIEDEGKAAKETEWVLDAAEEKPVECYPRGHMEWRKMEEMTNWVKYGDRSAKMRTENWPSDLINGSHCLFDQSDFCCNGCGEILSGIWNWIHQSRTALEKLRTGIFPVILINKDATVVRIPALQGTQEGEESLPSEAVRLQPLPTGSPEELCVKNSGSWPQRAEMHMKRMTSVSPDSCIFPYIEKHQISWDILFLDFLKNSFDIQIYLPFVANRYNLTPPPPPQSNSLGVTWDAVSQAWSPKNIHWIKHTSQL